jgi:cytochrome c-type biogenesis protein CcmE
MKNTFYALITIFAITSTLHAQDPMDMESLKTMKKECMKEHKDNKVCHEQVMAKCEEKSSKEDCTKMMKQLHKETKRKKHKK